MKAKNWGTLLLMLLLTCTFASDFQQNPPDRDGKMPCKIKVTYDGRQITDSSDPIDAFQITDQPDPLTYCASTIHDAPDPMGIKPLPPLFEDDPRVELGTLELREFKGSVYVGRESVQELLDSDPAALGICQTSTGCAFRADSACAEVGGEYAEVLMFNATAEEDRSCVYVCANGAVGAIVCKEEPVSGAPGGGFCEDQCADCYVGPAPPECDYDPEGTA